MDDLISREDLLKQLGISNRFNAGVPAWVIGVIKGMPSAQPEIIHCKDCKHYYYTDNRVFGERTWVCDILNFEDLDDDEFCARAERRTE